MNEKNGSFTLTVKRKAIALTVKRKAIVQNVMQSLPDAADDWYCFFLAAAASEPAVKIIVKAKHNKYNKVE